MPYSFRLTLWSPIDAEAACRTRGRTMHCMFCLHVEIIHSPRRRVTLALHLDVHIMMYSAPVHGRLSHDSRLTAPLGKLANVEVHREVALGAAECR